MTQTPQQPRTIYRQTRTKRYVTFHVQRVVRPPAETIAVWDRRRRTFAAGIAAYAGVALAAGGGVVSVLFLSAAVLSAAVVVKATVLINRARREMAAQARATATSPTP